MNVLILAIRSISYHLGYHLFIFTVPERGW